MHMRDEMAEATRLTRSGRLAEATALIQRTLGGPTGEAVDNPEHPPEESATLPHRGPRPGTGWVKRGTRWMKPGPAEEDAPVIDLMEALRRSVEDAKQAKEPAAKASAKSSARPRKKAAARK